jgi:hypothetical protein
MSETILGLFIPILPSRYDVGFFKDKIKEKSKRFSRRKTKFLNKGRDRRFNITGINYTCDIGHDNRCECGLCKSRRYWRGDEAILDNDLQEYFQDRWDIDQDEEARLKAEHQQYLDDMAWFDMEKDYNTDLLHDPDFEAQVDIDRANIEADLWNAQREHDELFDRHYKICENW